MARGHKRRKVGGRRRRGMAFRKTQIKIGGEIVARRVAPFAVDEAVGRRQELECVDAEVLEMRLAGRKRSHAREIARCRGPLHESKDVTKCPAGDADGALCLNPAPPRWQFVDDEMVVAGEAVEPWVVLPVRFVATRVAGHQFVVPPLHHGGRAAVVVGERQRQRRCAQSPIHRPGGGIRALDARRHRRLRVHVGDFEPIVIDAVVRQPAGCGRYFP